MMAMEGEEVVIDHVEDREGFDFTLIDSMMLYVVCSMLDTSYSKSISFIH